MSNVYRGEIEAILNGKPHRLRLTLGGLAELETHFQAEDLHALLTRFSAGRIAAADLLKVLSVALNGGGNPMDEHALHSVHCDGGLTGIANIIGELFTVTFAQNNG